MEVLHEKGSYDEYVAQTKRDYLNSNVALRLRFSKQFHHSEEEVVVPVKKTENYEDRKKQQSQKRALENSIKKLEEECHLIEKKIHQIDEKLTTDHFYQTAHPEELTKILKEKEQLDKKLMDSMLVWENASLELQQME